MSELDILRQEINEITQEMMILFERRLDVSKLIAKYKKENDLPIFQPEREKEIIERYLKNVKYKEVGKDFLISLMEISKQIQREEIEK